MKSCIKLNKTDKAVVGKLSADLIPSQNGDKDMSDITINADKLDLLINKPEETVRRRNNIIIKDVDLVYKLKKIVGSNNFSAQFIKIISNYKKIGYKINVLQQTACLVVNPIDVGKVSKGAKIRNRYNQVPHLTQDTNGKVTNSRQTPLNAGGSDFKLYDGSDLKTYL